MEVKGSTQGHTSPREVGKIPSQLFGPLIWGLEKEMATHFIILAWRLPRTEELGGLQTIRSQSQTWLKQLSTSEVNRTHCTFWVLSTMKSETLCPTWESVCLSLKHYSSHPVKRLKGLGKYWMNKDWMDEWVSEWMNEHKVPPRCMNAQTFYGKESLRFAGKKTCLLREPLGILRR